VHDSGLERAHAADLACELGVPFAAISGATRSALGELLDPGLVAANPLDVWGTGASTRELFGGCLAALAADEAVDAVALAVDLVTEYDADDSYRLAILDAAGQTGKPVAVLSNLASAVDHDAAARLRAGGVPVLEGMRSGLLALRHLLDHQHHVRRSGSRRRAGRHRAARAGAGEHRSAGGPASGGPASIGPASIGPASVGPASIGPADGGPADGGPASIGPADAVRAARARALIDRGRETSAAQLALLGEYGVAVARSERVTGERGALAAAGRIGYPVVLKTDNPAIAHKSDAGGVLLGLANPVQLRAAYAGLASRLGPAALVCETVPAGIELALGITRDTDLGPLVVVGAGGILVELIADRAVALPPLTQAQAAALLDELKVRPLLDGVRGHAPADLGAVAAAIAALAELACEVGEHIDALDVNPLICGPHGAVAADALVVPRS